MRLGRALLGALLTPFLAFSSFAGQIGSNRFHGGETIDTFTDDPTTYGNTLLTPFDRPYGDWIESQGVIRWTDGGSFYTFGTAIWTWSGNDFLEVELNAPADRVGGWVGANAAVTQFLDENYTLLGQVVSGFTGEPVFVGWEDKQVGIKFVRFNGAADTQIAVDNFTVEPAFPDIPVPDFGVDQHYSPTAPYTANFIDESTKNPESWSWEFGDGDSSTEQNPSHTYTEEGSYTVALTVGNITGFASQVVPDYIIVPEPSSLIQLGVGAVSLMILSRCRRRL